MLSRVQKTIRECHLLTVGDRVLVALSGGPDSVALLHVLVQLRSEYRLTLFAVYINHHLRPRAAAEEERFCERLCKKFVVPLTIVRGDVKALSKIEKKSVEETARDFRYAVFDRLADELNCGRIALGHHADDRAETILFRLVRGTGRTGLAGIPVKRGRITRPLYDVSKAEILTYLGKHRLVYCTDVSNSRSEYSRNFIRNKLLPLIEKRLNPGVREALLNLAETVGPEEEYLESLVDRVEGRVVCRTPGGKIILAMVRYRSYPVWFRRRLLRRCLKAICPLGRLPDREVTDRLDRLAIEGGRATSLPGGIQAAQSEGNLYLWSRHKPTYEIELPLGRPIALEWPALVFTAKYARTPLGRSRRKSPVVWLDASRVRGGLTVRNVRPGDRFRPLGSSGTKKVGDFLTDRKVPVPMRDEIPVVCDGDGIIWVVGYEIADRVKRDKTTRKVLKVAASQWTSPAP